ncbi:hypothetical protein CXIVA_24820 [Clostridium sp. SY8519]|uniref:hypothetical protein n=1 Tax=Clostridium sp. (strain SY8519) TaxID=1042156 RepID=UPI0002172295|nr:hypothetical protein [Clostridium sp. SY8519]BAK48449.1 hypothetical protein CXIVA_24820 [Clostridium sp. SY8519]
MGINLLSVFNAKDLGKLSAELSDIVSLNFGTNGKTGEKFARAVLDNGTTLIKSVTATGVEKNVQYIIPAFTSLTERNEIINDLSKNQKLTQEMIASMMNISQSTVSNVLRKSK